MRPLVSNYQIKKLNRPILLVFVMYAILMISNFSSILADQPVPIKHIIIIIKENHTFDNYFGYYPGANGINNDTAMLVDPNSTILFRPYHMKTSYPYYTLLCNSHHCASVAYDNGKMDGFGYTTHSIIPMGYFDHTDIPYYWDYASQFVLFDNFFSSVMGDSAPNHLYFLAGQSGSVINDNAMLSKVGVEIPTITDELDAKNISWKYYHGYWDPTQLIESLKVNSKLVNIVPEKQFLLDVANNNLPAVSWINPSVSEHSPENVTRGQKDTVSLVNAVMQSDYWNSTAIFITWDDWGGWYDHVLPPQVDKMGYGFRVPLLIISPYANQGFIDHTQSDFTSILKFTEKIFSLLPLTERDALANDLTEAFNFSQTPRTPLLLPGQYIPNHYPLEVKQDVISNEPTMSSLSVSADKQVYEYGDLLQVKIQIPRLDAKPLLFSIVNADGNTIFAQQMDLSTNNFTTSGILFYKTDYNPGTYQVTVEYSGLKASSNFTLIDSDKIVIPPKYKTIVKSWLQTTSNDENLAALIQELIGFNIIKVPNYHPPDTVYVPHWLLNDANWWSDGLISDDDFGNALQYLIDNQIISV